MADAKAAAKKAADSKPVGWLGRIGLASRGVVYIGTGWLVASLARGAHTRADQSGVLMGIAREPFGAAVLVVLAVGFLGYAVWRFSEAVLGVAGTDNRLSKRLRSAARGVPYVGLFATALTVLRGAAVSQSGKQKHVAASAMTLPGGRWIVGIVGVVLVGAGVWLVVEGFRKNFVRYFEYLPPGGRDVIVWMGRIGSIARGVVWGLAGSLVVYAAWTAQPSKAGGIDSAVRTLVAQPYGPFLVIAVGAGLILFGIYGLAEAAWRRIPQGDGK